MCGGAHDNLMPVIWGDGSAVDIMEASTHQRLCGARVLEANTPTDACLHAHACRFPLARIASDYFMCQEIQQGRHTPEPQGT
jgi:hypothetical protein